MGPGNSWQGKITSSEADAQSSNDNSSVEMRLYIINSNRALKERDKNNMFLLIIGKVT